MPTHPPYLSHKRVLLWVELHHSFLYTVNLVICASYIFAFFSFLIFAFITISEVPSIVHLRNKNYLGHSMLCFEYSHCYSKAGCHGQLTGPDQSLAAASDLESLVNLQTKPF